MEKLCAIHNDRLIEYACLAPGCSKNKPLCILCLKHDHTKCDYNYIVHSEDFNKLKIVKTPLNITEIANFHFKTKADSNKEIIATAFRQLKERTLKKLEFQSYDHEDILFLNNIDKLKQNYNINIQEGGNIVFTPKVQSDNSNVGETVRAYKKNINSAIEKLIKDIAAIKIDRVHQFITPRNFIGHKLLSIIYNDEIETITTRNNSDDQTTKKILIYSIPLTKTAVKLNVRSIDNSGDHDLESEFVSVGVMNQKTLNKYRKKNVDYIIQKYDELMYINSPSHNNFNMVEPIDKTFKRNYLCPGHSAIFMFKKSMSGNSVVELTDYMNYHLEKTMPSDQDYYLYIGLLNNNIEVEMTQDFSS